jgi:N-acetylneuraminate synthase
MIFKPAKLVAEIGAMHLGSMDRARKLIMLAKDAGADFVKFQKRNPIESVPLEIQNKPHPNAFYAYGETYLEHREALELTADQHYELFLYCKLNEIDYACSVWDMTSAKQISKINPSFIKIPSPCNQSFSLIDYIINNYEGDIHISTGMTDKHDCEKLLVHLHSHAKRFVVYHCTSIYPCPFDKLNLLEIEELCDLKKHGFRIGFSNHGYGIAADIAAYVLGAEYIERHFTDDRTLRHTDAAASLELDGMRKLARDLKNIQKSLNYKPSKIYDEERKMAEKLRNTIV